MHLYGRAARFGRHVLQLTASVAVLWMAAAGAAPAPADVSREMDAYLTARTQLGGFSGAVLFAEGGKLLLRKGYGYADVAGHVRYTPATRQEAASLSKMFTAMAALKLRDQGKLKLDDPICKYLSTCPRAWKTITVDQLIHHTSGIPDYETRLDMGSADYMNFMRSPKATGRIYADAKHRPLDFVPGTRFSYSNTGYIVLAEVIQSAAGESFGDYVTATILKPAHMDHSGMLGSGPRLAHFARGYSFGAIGWEKLLGGFQLDDGTLEQVPSLAFTPPAGDAWLYTDVDDLYRWSRIMDGSALVPRPETREAYTPGLGGYGAGWFVIHEQGALVYQHDGDLPGYVSSFVKLPGSKTTLIVLCNLDRARLDSITTALLAIARGKPYDMPVHGNPVTLNGRQLEPLQGQYRTADGATLNISRDGGQLSASIPGRYQADLIPFSPTEFYFPLTDGTASFILGTSGDADSVDLRYDGEDHRATRIAPKP